MPDQVRQWTVRVPHQHSTSTFEDDANAWRYARQRAEAQQPSVLTMPDGSRFYVFRADPGVEILTQHPASTTRRVVIP